MALIKCSHCGGVVSDKAERCPHCGTPVSNVEYSGTQKPLKEPAEKGELQQQKVEIEGKAKSVETKTVAYNQSGSEVTKEKESSEKKSLAWSFIGIGISAIILVVVFCWIANQSKRNSMETDSEEPVYVEDDHWEEDSLEIVNRNTPDLAFFEVHGPVKKVVLKTKDYTSVYEFDEEGTLKKLDGYNPFTIDVYSNSSGDYTGYKKDGKGRIVEATGWESHTNYSWNSERPSGCNWSSGPYEGKQRYDYDSRGFKVREFCEEQFYDGTEYESWTRNYTYNNVDEYGNWKSQKDNVGNTVTRTIVYYPITR